MDAQEEGSQMRHRRDQLLEATARAANILLTIVNLSEAINTALNIMGEGAGCDLITVIENNFESASPLPTHCECIYEWAAPGLPLRTANLNSKSFPAEFFGLAFLEEHFLEGCGFGGCLEYWHEPLHSWLASVQIQSAYMVPIRVTGQWWGLLSFDYCRAAIQLSPAEIEVLRTIADCIGSAIQRERLRHAELRLQQERQQVAQQRTADLEEYNQRLIRRDRLLEITARAANVLLTLDNIEVAIDSALTILIEGTGCDRIKMLENVYESFSPMPIRYLNTIHKCLDTKFEISPTDIEPAEAVELKDSFKKYFLEMDGFGGVLAEWDEPLRSWLAALQIQSTYAVPIRLKGQWWGILCFDYCSAPIQFSPAEIAVLRTTADCIGSAIQRERLRHTALRNQQEREQITIQRTTDLEAYNAVLRGRDRLFEATAKAANVLLTLENFDAAVNAALQLIGEGIGCDYVVVLENRFESSSPLPRSCDFIYEWASPGFLPLSVTFGSTCLPAELLGVDFMKQYFLEGDGFGGLTEEWNEPLRSVLVSVQVQSTYAVPIRVNGQWWGVLSLDYCRISTQVSTAEISVLMAIADCIGSAIERDRTQRERERSAQQRAADLENYNQRLLSRDRLLEVTAKATNVLLTLNDMEVAIETALDILLEGVGCDRIEILENVYESSSPMPIRYLNTIQKCLDPKFEISPTDIEPAEAVELKDSFKKYFLEMDGFGGVLAEWDEPLRSLMATLQIQSTYAVPIRVNSQWWGILCFDYCRAPIQIGSAEVAVLRTTADCIGSAIQRDRTQKALLEAEQNRSAELAKANIAMRRSIDWLAREPDMNSFLGHLMAELVTQIYAQDALIFLYDAQERTLETFVGAINDKVTFCSPFTQKFSVDEWLGWDVLLRSPNPRLFDLDTEPHLFLPEYLEFHRRRNNRGIVCTLLQQDDEPLGFIGFGCIRETFSVNELELVQSLAQQATLAIQMTRLAEEAKQTALLEERARMAQEIHDTLAQAFGGISMQLQAFSYFAITQPEKAQSHLLAAQDLAQEGLAEARRSVWTLYLESSEYEDLSQTIAKFLEQTASGQSTQIKLAIDGIPYRLHPDVGLNLLRIAQESIANALRHAQAETIQITISYSTPAVKLTIHDDGCGFEPRSPSRGFGLIGMQQRAARIGATWHLVSQAGLGTTIIVAIANPAIP